MTIQAYKAEQHFTIGQLAQLSGVSAKLIRYYESVGLLPQAVRADNGYRSYGQEDVKRLVLLRRARLLGVPLSALKGLLQGLSHARCIEVQQELLQLVNERLAAIEREIAELHLLRDQVRLFQLQLSDCHPDARTTFSECLDGACLASPNTTRKGDLHVLY